MTIDQKLGSRFVVKLPPTKVLGQSGHHHNARLEVQATADGHRVTLKVLRGTEYELTPLVTVPDLTPNKLKQIAAELLAIAEQLVEARGKF